MLPSGYKVCSGIKPIYSSTANTNIYPSNTLSIDGLFSGIVSESYVFGARNTNSNTSAGQINFYYSQNNASYYGYRSARVSISKIVSSLGFLHFHNDQNEGEFVFNNDYIVNPTGATGDFTGTQTIYLGGLNNGGARLSGGGSFHGFTVYDNGTLVGDFIPCREESSGNYGIYDLVTESFEKMRSDFADHDYAREMFLLTVGHSDGGMGYAKTFHGESVTEIYGGDHDAFAGYDKLNLYAVANNGYVFLNWTDGNGDVVSTENSFEYGITQAETITANFIKKTDIDAWLGYKTLAIRYGVADGYADVHDSLYAEVLNADIMVDTMQKTTSKITLKDVPSAYQTNMGIALLNPKGKVIYVGLIKNIENKTLVCREPLAVFDEDFLFHVNTNLINSVNLTQRSVLKAMAYYMERAMFQSTDNTSQRNALQDRKTRGFLPSTNEQIDLQEYKVFNVTTPLIDQAGVKNLEDYLMEMFDSFGAYVRSKLVYRVPVGTQSPARHYIEMMPYYIKQLNTILVSDNVENVKNVSISIEEAENTVLALYNSAGTTFKKFFGLKKNGSIGSYDSNTSEGDLIDFIGYSNFKLKIVCSDDKQSTIVSQNISNAMFNHKISFDLDLDGSMFDIDSFELGQPINFYYQNKMYESVVTGLKFNIAENDDNIHSVSVTLGKVRNNLTSKLNLKK